MVKPPPPMVLCCSWVMAKKIVFGSKKQTKSIWVCCFGVFGSAFFFVDLAACASCGPAGRRNCFRWASNRVPLQFWGLQDCIPVACSSSALQGLCVSNSSWNAQIPASDKMGFEFKSLSPTSCSRSHGFSPRRATGRQKHDIETAIIHKHG